jgi:hypothetical protein
MNKIRSAVSRDSQRQVAEPSDDMCWSKKNRIGSATEFLPHLRRMAFQ